MNDLIARLHLANDPTADAAAEHIASLSERVAIQQTVMDRAASILVEAITSTDGINEAKAEACVGSIRGQLVEVGQTTAEEHLDNLYARTGAAAGIAPHIEFNLVQYETACASCCMSNSATPADLPGQCRALEAGRQ